MKKNVLHFLRYLLPLIPIAVLTLVLTAMHELLRKYHYKDIIHYLREIPTTRVELALFFTAASYLLLTIYDTLGVRSIEHPLPYRRIALASFIGYAFNNNLGFAGLGGNALRYRIYTSWGLSAVEVAKVIAFCVLTFWLGFLAVAGFSFLVDPIPIPTGLPVRITSLRPLGFIFLIPVGFYLVWSARRKEPLRFRDWQLSLPPLKISLAQIFAAALDWAAAAAVFYVLLPASGHISYPQVIGLFLLAQILGLLSHVPGGLGVFEFVMMVSLTPPHSVLADPYEQPQVFGALVAYRAIYYLLPLGTAVVMLGVHEITLRLEHVKKTVRLIGQWVPALVPNVFAFATFVAGALLLFSGATPAVYERLTFLHHYIPEHLMEAAHLFSSMTGAALLLLARGLQRRLDSAYLLTLALLAAAIPFSLIKGFDYEEAMVLMVILLAFIPCRMHFYRKASLLSRHSISSAWIVAIILTIIGSIWFGIFSYKRIFETQSLAQFQRLWTHVSLNQRGDASKFLRASIGAIGVVALYCLKVLLRPAPPEAVEHTEEDWRKVREIVEQSPRTYAWSALLRDKQILMSMSGKAFIMYGVEGRSWVALGDPVGPEDEKDELAWQFRELSDSHGGWTVFYHVTPEHLPLYLDLGLVLLKLGEEAMVPLDAFSLEGSARKNLRGSHKKVVREGFRFEVLPREAVQALLPRLNEISNAWLAAKNTREKCFSLGFFSEPYLAELPLAVVHDAQGTLVAFANVWCGADREELSIDMMRYAPELPGGIMDYLFVELMLYGKAQGYHWFNLGMAPLSGLDTRALAPLWTRIGSMIFRHGEHFYNFKGLRQYKEKFDPVWVPKYLASPGGIALPRILTNIAALISGGVRGILHK